ncbi:hypothetical protein ACFE04_031717 [Oxalis oulophora]
MQDMSKDSQALGICQRLFYFFMDNLMVRGLKRITFGKPVTEDHHLSLLNPKDDPNFDIRIQFKQTERLAVGNDRIPNIRNKGNSDKITEELPCEMKIPLVNGIEANDINSDFRPSGPTKIDTADEDKIRRKGKGVNLTSDKINAEGKKKASHLTFLVVQPEELNARSPRRIKPLLDVAANINEKSDAFIRSKKEKMSRHLSLEGNYKKR